MSSFFSCALSHVVRISLRVSTPICTLVVKYLTDTAHRHHNARNRLIGSYFLKNVSVVHFFKKYLLPPDIDTTAPGDQTNEISAVVFGGENEFLISSAVNWMVFGRDFLQPHFSKGKCVVDIFQTKSSICSCWWQW